MTVSIILSDNQDIGDIQLWYKHQLPVTSRSRFVKVHYIDYSKTPVYLLQSGLIDIYTDLETTEQYFKDTLVRHSLEKIQSNKSQGRNTLGMLCKSSDNDSIYLIMLLQDMKVKGLVLDFTVVNKLNALSPVGDLQNNCIIDFKTRLTDVQVFDKVLEKKKNRLKSSTTSQQTSSLATDNADHTNSMISRVILSGLRLRGLSTTQANSSNEKVKIKEIYQMTFKSTCFALRKFGNRPVELNVIQDMVEQLLQIFVDVEDSLTSNNPFLDT